MTDVPEMVERVAKAIFGNYDKTTGFGHTYQTNVAIIAIEAMREPTEAMVNTAAVIDFNEECWVGRELAEKVYRAMIDKALGERPCSTPVIA